MKILLIEDDKFFREFYSLKLREKDIEVEIASDGEEGLQKIAASKPDVILLDLIMPHKDGFEVLTALKQNGVLDTVSVLVFSTLGQEQDIQKAISLGAKGYVNKSFFDFEVLLKKILEISNK